MAKTIQVPRYSKIYFFNTEKNITIYSNVSLHEEDKEKYLGVKFEFTNNKSSHIKVLKDVLQGERK